MLKGDRCYGAKCAMERRPYPPGEHGGGTQRRRNKESAYGLQLREKQKARRIYGILERQFRIYAKEAVAMRGVSAQNLIQMCERRLDNVVYRLGFTYSRAEARELISHGHFVVGGRKVNVASYLVKVNEEVGVREKSRSISAIRGAMESSLRSGLPTWVVREDERFLGKMVRLPDFAETSIPVKPERIVELYSR
jgi:small subunit ribosomal protein S4